jgi:hypothetical protein
MSNDGPECVGSIKNKFHKSRKSNPDEKRLCVKHVTLVSHKSAIKRIFLPFRIYPILICILAIFLFIEICVPSSVFRNPNNQIHNLLGKYRIL